MAEQSQGDLRQVYSDLGLTETVPVTTNYMIPVTTNYLEPVSTMYPNPSLNYPYYSVADYINANMNFNMEGQVQEEIVFDQNVVNVTSAASAIDMSVPLDMTVKKDNGAAVKDSSTVDKDNIAMEVDSFAVDNVNSEHPTQYEDFEMKSTDMTETVESITAISAVTASEDDVDYGEVLQKCPICQKMFMKSDYENFHINTHKIETDATSNVPEENVTVTEANLQPVNEDNLYCTEADFQNVIEENVYARAANVECSEENAYITNTDLPMVTENDIYVSKADLQTTDQDNMYVAEPYSQSSFRESVYVTSELQDMPHNIVYSSTATFDHANEVNVGTTTAPDIDWEDYQAVTSNEEVKGSSENLDTGKRLVTIEYRETGIDAGDVAKPTTSLSPKPGTAVTESPETNTVEYNIPYSVVADEQFYINSTSKQTSSAGMVTTRDAEIPVNDEIESGLSNSMQTTDIGKKNEYENENAEALEALSGSLNISESSVGSFPSATLSVSVNVTSAVDELLCTTRELPTTVLESVIEPEPVQNVMTEPVVEHLSDDKVTGLLEQVGNSENSKVLPMVENLHAEEKAHIELYEKQDELIKSDIEIEKEQVSNNVTSYKLSAIDRDSEDFSKMKDRVATTINMQTEETLTLPVSCEPILTENSEISTESFKSTEKEMDKLESVDKEMVILENGDKEMDKLDNVDNNTTENDEVLVTGEQEMSESASKTQSAGLEPQNEAKLALDQLHIDEVKSILDDLINKASLVQKVEFKTSFDSGTFLCSRCSEMFVNNDTLKTHLETDHSDEYEMFTVYDPQEDIVVIEDEHFDIKKPEGKIKAAKDIGGKRDKVENNIENKKNKDRQTKTVERIETAIAKTPETKKIEAVNIFDSSVILQGKRKRSINRKFGADFIVDIDIINEEVKRHKKQESPMKSPKSASKQKHKSVLKSPNRNDAKPKSRDKTDTKQEVKVKNNYFARLTIQRKLMVISNGLRECPICYRRVYGQLGLKSHMDSHTPTDKIPEKQKEPLKKITDKISERPKTPTDKIPERPKTPTDKIPERLKTFTDKIPERSKTPGHKIPEMPKTPTGNISERPKTPTDKISERPKAPTDKISERPKTPTDKILAMPEDPIKKTFSSIKESPTISKAQEDTNKLSKIEIIPGKELPTISNVQEGTDMVSKTETVSEKSVDDSRKAIQEKLASMQVMNKESHECLRCHINLPTQKGLLVHMKAHQKERELTPEYESKKVIQDKLVNLGKDLHECPVCSRMIAGKHPFKLHMKTHNIDAEFHEDRKVKTDTTKKTFTKLETEKIQVPDPKTAKDDQRIEKKDNESKFGKAKEDREAEQKNKTVIQEKLASIVGGELHECPICSRLIYGKVRLEAHLKSHSPTKTISEVKTEPKISSSEAGTITKEMDNSGDQNGSSEDQKDISENIKEDCKDEFLECSKCSKRVHGQHRLAQHMQSHTRTEQLKENLSKLANQREKVIEKRYSAEPLFECSICSKQVHGKYRLDAHMKYKHNDDDDEKEVSFNLKSDKRKSVDNDGSEKSKRKKELENDIEMLDQSETEMEIENLDGAETETTHDLYVKCKVCLKLQKKNHLQRHMQSMHSSHQPFECKICSVRFRRKDGLTQHMERHAKSRDFLCNKCHKTFLCKADLRKHLRRHSEQPRAKCKDCKLEFTSSVELAKHRKIHVAQSSGEHCCNDCGKKFTHYYQLTKHQRLHRKGTVTVAMKHSCTKCGRMFATRSQLEGHLPVHNVLTRARATKHSCRKCGKYFQFRYQLENHMPVHSEKGKDMAIHTRSSTPEHTESKRPKDTIPKLTKTPKSEVTKSHAVKIKEEMIPPRLTRASTPILGSKFEIDTNKNVKPMNVKSENNTKDKTADLNHEVKSDLLNHKKTYNSEPELGRSLSTRKTNCKICGKSFEFKANLMQHLKAHSEIREYSCGRCGKYFSTQEMLNKHTQSHKGEEIACASCKKKFAHGKSLKRHLIRCEMKKREARSLGRKK